MSRAHRPPVFAPLVRDPRVRGLSSFLGGSSALSRPDMVGARLAYTLALAVLMLDVALPPWVSVPVLYVVPVVYLAWRTQLSPMTGVYPLALTCTVLTVAAWPLNRCGPRCLTA
jgi:hypothetical protein